MIKAHATIVRLGGIPKANTYTKLFLAMFGQYPWKHLPIIPSEIILLPNWLYFNIYEMSSWSRGMVVPLSIINHFKPTRHLPPEKQLHELFPYGTEHSNLGLPFDKKLFTWKNFFLGWNSVLKFLDTLPWKPFRQRALKKAEAWILERIGDGSDGLGAIFPSMMYTIMVLKTLGYGEDHPVMRKAMKDFLGLEVHDEETDEFRMQPCLSPIWDSAITAFALVESGVPADHPQIQKAGEWIISKEVKDFRGDWKHKNPTPITSGWAFEFNNKYYPDVDDTFKVLLALGAIKMPDEAAKKEVDGARAGLGGQLPVQERRVRRLRQGRDQEVAAGRALRRSQRDSRSALQRHHLARAGSFRPHGRRARRSRSCSAPSALCARRSCRTARGKAAGA